MATIITEIEILTWFLSASSPYPNTNYTWWVFLGINNTKLNLMVSNSLPKLMTNI